MILIEFDDFEFFHLFLKLICCCHVNATCWTLAKSFSWKIFLVANMNVEQIKWVIKVVTHSTLRQILGYYYHNRISKVWTICIQKRLSLDRIIINTKSKADRDSGCFKNKTPMAIVTGYCPSLGQFLILVGKISIITYSKWIEWYLENSYFCL